MGDAEERYPECPLAGAVEITYARRSELMNTIWVDRPCTVRIELVKQPTDPRQAVQLSLRGDQYGALKFTEEQLWYVPSRPIRIKNVGGDAKVWTAPPRRPENRAVTVRRGDTLSAETAVRTYEREARIVLENTESGEIVTYLIERPETLTVETESRVLDIAYWTNGARTPPAKDQSESIMGFRPHRCGCYYLSTCPETGGAPAE